MVRFYAVMGLALAALFSVLMLVSAGAAQFMRGYELAFSHCDDSREHCTLRLLDAERGLGFAYPLAGQPFVLEWSPDGRRLAISQLTVNGSRLSLYDGERAPTLFQPIAFLSAWLSPDSLLLQRENGSVVVYDFASGASTPYPLRALGEHTSFYFTSISPGGHYIATNPMDSADNVVVVEPVDAAGETLRLDGSIIDSNFDWSPDNQTIAFSTFSGANLDIFIASLTTGATQQITSAETDEMRPRLSHDGRLAFITRASIFQYFLNIQNNDGTLYTVDLTAQVPADIVDVYALEWSADDRYLVLQISFGSSIGEVYVIAADGDGTLRRLAYDGNNTFPTWRP